MTLFKFIRKLVAFLDPVYMDYLSPKTKVVTKDFQPVSGVELREKNGEFYIKEASPLL